MKNENSHFPPLFDNFVDKIFYGSLILISKVIKGLFNPSFANKGGGRFQKSLKATNGTNIFLLYYFLQNGDKSSKINRIFKRASRELKRLALMGIYFLM